MGFGQGGYIPAGGGAGPAVGITMGKDSATQTLTAGDNVINHANGARAIGCNVFDSTDSIHYPVDWVNTDVDNVTITWIGADLTNAKIYLTF